MIEFGQDPKGAPQQPSQDPLRAEYREQIRQQQKQADETRAAAFNQAVKADPAKARAASRVARDLGFDPGLVERNTAEANAILARREFEMAQVAKHSPILARQMVDPDFARQVPDDWKNLGMFERIGYANEMGRLTYEQSRIGSRMFFGSESADDYRRLADIKARMARIPPSEGFIANAVEITAQMSETMAKAAVVGAAGAAIGSAAGPGAVVTAPVGFALGAGSVMITEGATSAAGAHYLDLIAKNVDPTMARVSSSAVGVVSGLLNTVGVGVVTAPIRNRVLARVTEKVGEQLVRPTVGKAGAEFAKNYLKANVGETGTEIGEEVSAIISEGLNTGDWEGAADRIAEVASKTAQGMVLLGLPGPTFGFVHDVQRAKAAMDDRARFAKESAIAVESKLRAENPAEFQKVAEKMTPGDLHIEAGIVLDVLRQADKSDIDNGKAASRSYTESIDDLIPGLAGRLQEAAKTGGDVTISRAEFQAKLAGTPIGNVLEPHLRQNKEDPSPAEAEWALQNLPEMEKGVEAQAISDEQWETEAKDIETQIGEQIVAAGRTKGEARRSARLTRLMFETLAEGIAGETPASVWKKWNVRVVAGEADATGLQQPGRAVTETPEFKAWFGDSKAIESGRPIRLWRGTAESAPTEFRTDESPLIFLTTEKGTAESYAKERGGVDGGGVTEVFLSAQKPLDLRTEEGRQALRDLKLDDAMLKDDPRAEGSADYIKERAAVAVRLASGDAHQWMATQFGPDRKGQSMAWDMLIVPALERLGYDGLILNDAPDSPGTTWAAFRSTQVKSPANRGTFDPTDPNILRQPGRGSFNPANFTITLSKASDPSTFVHELAHAWLTIYEQAFAQKLSPQIVDDFRAFLKWSGNEESAWASMTIDQKRKAHENFAANFETYLWEGKAPEPALRRLFAWFTSAMRNVYRAIRDTLNASHRKEFGEDLLDLTPEIRGVFDRMIAAEDRVRVTQQIRGSVPAFLDRADFKGTDEEWQKIQDEQKAADAAAVDEIARRSVADMRWLSGAKARNLREIQAEAKKVRAEVRAKVAADVQSRPVYRATRWLKTGEFRNPDGTFEKHEKGVGHKLNREAVRVMFGLQDLDLEPDEPKPVKAPKVRSGPSLITRIKQLGGISPESWNKSWPGEKRGEWRIPFVVRKGGMTWDQMAQTLSEEGYGPEPSGEDGIGSGDTMWFVDTMADAAGGGRQYSRFAEQFDAPEGPNVAPESPEERADRIESERIDAEERRAAGASVQVAKPEKVVANKLRGMLSATGYSPDEVASLFGYEAGDTMVREIVESPEIEAAIEAATDAEMLRRHGKLSDPAQMEEAIVLALHGEARRRFVASELRALEGATGPMRLTVATAKMGALAALERRRVGQIVPRSIAAEARRASEKARRRQADGDAKGAIAAKRQQLILEQMVDLAADVQQEVADTRKLFDSRHLNRADEDIAKGRDIDYVNAARALGAAFSLNLMRSEQHRQQAFAAVEKIRGARPDIAERLVPLVAQGARQPVNFRELTRAEFREVAELTKLLWEESSRAKVLDAEGKKLEIDAGGGQLAAQVATMPARMAPGALPPDGMSPTDPQRWVMRGWHPIASLTRARHWARFMDGGRDNGPFQRLLIDPIVRATTRYRTAKAEMVQKVADLLTAHAEASGAAWTSRIEAKELGHTFRGKNELLDAILHAGSPSGLEKLLVPYGWGEMVALDDGTEVLDTRRWDRQLAKWVENGTLTKADIAFLNSAWKLYSTVLPESQKAHKALYGYEFETIETQSHETAIGKLDGGYVPARIDRDLADPKAIGAMTEEALAEAGFRFAVSTNKGFTLKRNPLYRQKLMLDLGRHMQALDGQLMFIHLQPALADARRLFNHREVAAAIDGFDRAARERIVTPFLQNVALQSTTRPGMFKVVDWGANVLRRAASIAALGFNVANSLAQATGLSNARMVVPGSFLRAGARRFWSNPAAAFREVTGKSEAMRQRYDLQTQKLQEQMDRLDMGPIRGGIKAFQSAAARLAFAPQRFIQMSVDFTVWNGAYQKAVADGATEVDAIARADNAVVLTQGSQNPEDMAAYEVTTPVGKLFTQFGGYGNLLFNQVVTANGLAGKAKAGLWVLLLPAIMEATIRGLITGGPDDDDKDGSTVDEWAGLYGKGMGRQVAGMFPVVGAMVSSLIESEGSRVNSPVSTAITGFGRGLFETLEAMTGDDVTASEAVAMATFWSGVLRIPIAAPARMVRQIAGEK